jgi:hypothetical protein
LCSSLLCLFVTCGSKAPPRRGAGAWARALAERLRARYPSVALPVAGQRSRPSRCPAAATNAHTCRWGGYGDFCNCPYPYPGVNYPFYTLPVFPHTHRITDNPLGQTQLRKAVVKTAGLAARASAMHGAPTHLLVAHGFRPKHGRQRGVTRQVGTSYPHPYPRVRDLTRRLTHESTRVKNSFHTRTRRVIHTRRVTRTS